MSLFKIKKGKLEAWLNWCKLLHTTYRKDAIRTLSEEGLTHEGFGIFKLNEEHYTIGFSVGENLPANMNKEINQKHRAMKKECLEKIGPVELNYELATGSLPTGQ
ncbi:MAG: DUF6176 family protein [Candidatus Andersenbacteria bacterium]